VALQEERDLVLAEMADLRVLAEGLRVMQARQGRVEGWVLRLGRELAQVQELVLAEARVLATAEDLVLAEELVEVLEPWRD
jgi:hypothetical protein